MMNEAFIIPKWPVPENIRAIQTTRNVAISLEKYSSLNLSNNAGETKEHGEVNYNNLLNILPSDPIWLNQIHSDKSEELPSKKILNCDASYTYNKKIVCAVGFSGKPEVLERVCFHREMLCVTYFGIVLGVCIVRVVIFYQNMIKKFQDNFL